MTLETLLNKKDNLKLNAGKLMTFGLVGLIAGLVILGVGFTQVEGTRVWGSMLMNLLFFYAIALGGVVLGSIQDVIGALWGRPIRRVHESFGTFLIPATVLFIVFLICVTSGIGGAQDVYSWVANPKMLDYFPGKNEWLTPNGLLYRNIFTLLVILGMALWTMKMGLAPDALIKQGKIQEGLQKGEWVRARLRFWSAPMLFVYGLGFTFLCFDITMSLSPLWFSTLWGGWSFAVMMVTLLATTLVCMFLLKGTEIGSVFKRQQFHDVGKLMHGFTIFFAYLTFAHILTYWYGNVPEETEYFLHRMHNPWLAIVIVAPFLSFALPLFVLIPKASKWYGPVAVPISLIILVAQWMTYLIVVMPETADASAWAKSPVWVEFGGFCAMAGLFAVCVAIYGKRNYMVPIGDPLLNESLNDHH